MLCAFFLIFSMLLGCGAGNDGKEENGQSGRSDNKSSDVMKKITKEDAMGIWYGQDPEGRLYTLLIHGDEDDPEKEWNLDFRLFQCNKAYESGLDVKSGVCGITTGLDTESGKKISYIEFQSSDIRNYMSMMGEDIEKLSLRGVIYKNNKMTYKLEWLDEEIQKEYGDKFEENYNEITFSKELPFPDFHVDRENGTVSGIWYGRKEANDIEYHSLLMLYENGTFFQFADDIPAGGTYVYKDNVITFQYTYLDTEDVDSSEYTVERMLNEENQLLADDGTHNLIQGGIEGVWEDAVERKMELYKDGSFCFDTSEYRRGIYAEAEDKIMLFELFCDEEPSIVERSIQFDNNGNIWIQFGGRIVFKKAD